MDFIESVTKMINKKQIDTIKKTLSIKRKFSLMGSALTYSTVALQMT